MNPYKSIIKEIEYRFGPLDSTYKDERDKCNLIKSAMVYVMIRIDGLSHREIMALTKSSGRTMCALFKIASRNFNIQNPGFITLYNEMLKIHNQILKTYLTGN